MGTASGDDFDKLFEDLVLTSSKLGRRRNIARWRYSGRWSTYLAITIWVSSLTPAMALGKTCAGAGA